MTLKRVQIPKNPEIEKLLKDIKICHVYKHNNDIRQFVKSVKEQYLLSGKLSDRQKQALHNIINPRSSSYIDEGDYDCYNFGPDWYKD